MVLEVAGLRHLRERVVRIDESDQHAPPLGRELQTASDLVGDQGTSFLVMTRIRGLAGVVEQDGEIEDGGVFELLENRPVALEPTLVG